MISERGSCREGSVVMLSGAMPQKPQLSWQCCSIKPGLLMHSSCTPAAQLKRSLQHAQALGRALPPVALGDRSEHSRKAYATSQASKRHAERIDALYKEARAGSRPVTRAADSSNAGGDSPTEWPISCRGMVISVCRPGTVTRGSCPRVTLTLVYCSPRRGLQ